MDTPTKAIKFYRYALSGHSHRVELFLSLLGLPIDPIDVDLIGGEQHGAAFLAINCFGQVPVIQDGDVTVADSNAILVYLAGCYGGERWLPRDPARAALVQRWLSIAAGQVAYGPCVARLVTVFKMDFNLKEAIARAHALFRVMDGELQRSSFLAADHPTIADIANYTYIAHASEGNVSLEPYPHLCAWLARIEALPGFVPMPNSVVISLAA